MTTYGSDLSCVSDLDPTMREVSEDRGMLESIARRVTTSRGSAIDAPDDGIDIRDWLSASLSNVVIASLQLMIRGEVMKDERVLEAGVIVTYDAQAQKLTVRIAGLGADGPFRLTLPVSATRVELLEG